jgi:regulator of replication initiation timing
MSNKQNKSQNYVLWSIIIVIGAIAAYFFYAHEQDRRIANRIYQQLLSIDSQLDSLQESATMIKTEKITNTAIIQSIKSLTKDNIDTNKTATLEQVKQITYNDVVKVQLTALLNSSSSQNFKTQRKLIIQQLRLLKYQNGMDVQQFNNQIGHITDQVSQLKDQVAKIKSNDLQDLESAKLKFIVKKLKTTISDMHESLVTEIVDDVIDKAESNEIPNDEN